MACYARVRDERRGGDPSMACKDSGRGDRRLERQRLGRYATASPTGVPSCRSKRGQLERPTRRDLPGLDVRGSPSPQQIGHLAAMDHCGAAAELRDGTIDHAVVLPASPGDTDQ
jgi:hypothetical protein